MGVPPLVAVAGLSLASAGSAQQVTVPADFEDGLQGRTTEGEAFGVSCIEGNRWGRQAEGRHFADSTAPNR